MWWNIQPSIIGVAQWCQSLWFTWHDSNIFGSTNVPRRHHASIDDIDQWWIYPIIVWYMIMVLISSSITLHLAWIKQKMGIFNCWCCKNSVEDWYQKKGVRASHWGAKVAGTKADGKADHVSYRVAPKDPGESSEYFYLDFFNVQNDESIYNIHHVYDCQAMFFKISNHQYILFFQSCQVLHKNLLRFCIHFRSFGKVQTPNQTPRNSGKALKKSLPLWKIS